jgi:hypothetical protein
MSQTPSMSSAMPRMTQVILWAYVAFNLLIAATLIGDPAQVDATYRGGPMTATREFQWFSIGSFHLFMVGVTLAALRMRSARERGWLLLMNAAFYSWDALTEWSYWGAHVGVAPLELHRNAGVSAACGLLLIVAWRHDLARAGAMQRAAERMQAEPGQSAPAARG